MSNPRQPYRWTPLKAITLMLAIAFLVAALIAKAQDNSDAAGTMIAGAMGWGILFGLLNVTSFF